MQEPMSGRWSRARAFLNQDAKVAMDRWANWYTRPGVVGKLPQIAFYLVSVGIAWWIGGPRLAVILVLISLAVGVAIFVVGLIVVAVVMWRGRRA